MHAEALFHNAYSVMKKPVFDIMVRDAMKKKEFEMEMKVKIDAQKKASEEAKGIFRLFGWETGIKKNKKEQQTLKKS